MDSPLGDWKWNNLKPQHIWRGMVKYVMYLTEKPSRSKDYWISGIKEKPEAVAVEVAEFFDGLWLRRRWQSIRQWASSADTELQITFSVHDVIVAAFPEDSLDTDDIKPRVVAEFICDGKQTLLLSYQISIIIIIGRRRITSERWKRLAS